MKKKTVAIISDRLLFRHALKSLINTFEQFQVIYETERGNTFIENLNKPSSLPDIVLIDKFVSGSNGIETLRQIVDFNMSINCIILSDNNDHGEVFNMINNGAKAYILNTSSAGELEEAMLDIIARGASYSPFVVEKLIEHERKKSENSKVKNHPLNLLTEREKEFIRLSCSSMPFKQIAVLMNVTERTIDSHKQNIFKKLNFHSREEIILFAFDNGLYEKKKDQE